MVYILLKLPTQVFSKTLNFTLFNVLIEFKKKYRNYWWCRKN